MISVEERKERLNKYSTNLILNAKGRPKIVNPLFCRAEKKYFFMSKVALLCVDEVRLLGFNKLNEDWNFDPKTKVITRLAIPKTYSEVAEYRESESYPISPTLNGVDGITCGLYLATCELVTTGEIRNYLFDCRDNRCKIIDLQNSSEFDVYESLN